MFVFSEGDMRRFGVEVFAGQMQKELLEDYPDLFDGVPEDKYGALVSHMIARAEARGLRDRRAVALFCRLMASVAPNFDRLPAVDAWLRGYDEGGPDARMISALDGVADDDWRDAETLASVLPLYTPPALDSAPSAERAAAAAAFLWSESDSPLPLLRKAQAAEALGLRWCEDKHDDLTLWLTRCLMVYGDRFPEDEEWARPLYDHEAPLPACVAAELVRLRLEMDGHV